jgi:hypothetical protein
MFWVYGFAGSGSTVPSNKVLEVTSLTVNFFPAGAETVGRADIAGRNAAGISVWRLQCVYVEPKKTVHLTFPAALRLEPGGYLELGFTSDGPGTLLVEANGQLIGQSAAVLAGDIAEPPTTLSTQ